MSSSIPFPFTSDMDYSDLYVNVILRDVNNEESFPIRHFPVGSSWTFKIGRGSQNDDKLNPQAHNSWFGSRVMSREHAEVHIDQITREIKISDLSSMHGTYLYGEKLIPGQKTKLYTHDVVTFGTDVVRGEHTYRPLQLAFEFEWSDEAIPTGFPIPRYQGSLISGFGENHRSAADEIEMLGGTSILHTDSQLQTKPRTFSVPDSDGSDSNSEKGDNQHSSPLTFEENDNDEIAEICSVKVPQSANTAGRAPSAIEGSSEPNKSQIIIIDDEATHTSKQDSTVNMAKIFKDIQQPVIQAINIIDANHHRNDDDVDDEEDDDFNSEAADFHMHLSDDDDDDDDDEDEDDDDEGSADEDYPDVSGDDAEALDATDHRKIQVAEFLQPVVNDFINDFETAHLTQSNSSFSRQNDMIPPAFNNFYGLNQGSTQYFGSQPVSDTNPVSEPVLQSTREIPVGSGRVSIHNIINEADAPTEARLKRKADVLIDHDSQIPDPSLTMISELLPNLESNGSRETKVESAVEEPPTKMAKLEGTSQKENSRSKTFLKYTATAVAGAAVGAVTAVFGLAALPADYFL